MSPFLQLSSRDRTRRKEPDLARSTIKYTESESSGNSPGNSNISVHSQSITRSGSGLKHYRSSETTEIRKDSLELTIVLLRQLEYCIINDKTIVVFHQANRQSTEYRADSSLLASRFMIPCVE